MRNILEKIVAQKKNDINKLKKKYGKINLEKRTKKIVPFEKIFYKTNRLKIIAEIKPASPSEGEIIKESKIPDIVKIYNDVDIDAISVLTDKPFFNGKFENLKIVSKITDKPILCKDFIIDEYQIDLAYINNADAILLILEALDINKLKKLYTYATELGLGILVELHYQENVNIINRNKFRLIGINNRNLKTMEVNINNSIKLKKLIKVESPIISESGIYKSDDLLRLDREGFNGALIGTSILKSENMKGKLEELINYKNRGKI